MIPAEEIFIRTYDDIERILNIQDAYKRLKMAACLRQLFVEGRPLVDVVNQRLQIKLKFTVNDFVNEAKQINSDEINIYGLNIVPTPTTPEFLKKELTANKFLAMPLFVTDTRTITVRQVISHLANKAGGVHYDPTRKQEDLDFENIMKKLPNGGLEEISDAINAIAIIALRGLAPLKEAILQIPEGIEVFAHHIFEYPGKEFDGKSQYGKRCFSHRISEGWGIHAAIHIKPLDKRGTQVIYELGNQECEYPRLTLLLNESGDLIGRLAITEVFSLEVMAEGFSRSNLIENLNYVSLEVSCSEKTLLLLTINDYYSSEDEMELDIRQSNVNMDTIGSNNMGKELACFRLCELLVSSAPLGNQLRALMAFRFGMQWHID